MIRLGGLGFGGALDSWVPTVWLKCLDIVSIGLEDNIF